MKRGRPLAAGEPQVVVIKARVTERVAERIDEAKGGSTRAEWVRQQIEKGLPDEAEDHDNRK